MSHPITHVDPFDERLTPPPNPVVMLLSETELLHLGAPQKKLLCEERYEAFTDLNRTTVNTPHKRNNSAKDQSVVERRRSPTPANNSSAHIPSGRGATPGNRLPTTHTSNPPYQKPAVTLQRVTFTEGVGGEESDPNAEADGKEDDSADSTYGESEVPNDLIPKPPGEAGRPGRGGYNLVKEIGWHPRIFGKFKVGNYSLGFYPRDSHWSD